MKNILAIDVPIGVAKEIKEKFSEKDEFTLFSQEAMHESVGNMTIADDPDDIDLVLLNLKRVEGSIDLADYAISAISLVRDAIDVNVPMVITCPDPGNQISKLIDVIREAEENKGLKVVGRIIPDDLPKLFKKALEMSSCESAVAVA